MSQDKKKQEEARSHLVDYAMEWLAEWSGTGRDGSPSKSETWLKAYRDLLGTGSRTAQRTPLLSIFSRVQREGVPKPTPVYWPAQPLSMDKPAYPTGEEDAREQAEYGVWDGFLKEWETTANWEPEARFEAFGHLLHKWAWAVPCSYGEAGVSLYEEFRALSALVHASGCEQEPAKSFLLVGGDIPGIQDFVYTITSKGAAKGLRGRSFFIQLLGDAVVRRLLNELELPETNVIYAAGGNFMLLAEDTQGAKAKVAQVARQVNARLVEAIQGDTALVLQQATVPRDELCKAGQFGKAREAFGAQVARAKGQPLRELAADWETLFAPKGKGSELSCAVCRIEVDEKNSKWLEPTGEVEEEDTGGLQRPRICYLFASFGELARDIRHRDLWMEVVEVPKKLGTEVEPADGWTELLERMTGYRYSFSDQRPADPACTLAINEPGFLEAGACGFRLLANVTPTNTREDVAYLRQKAGEEEDVPRTGEIRSFALLARAAAEAGALERVGVLRMDVDGLGWVFSKGVPDLTLPKLGALSSMMDLFFGGYLNTLVRGQAPNDLYTIYAGGDDLFIVGAWHHLPGLAEAIHDRFHEFTGRSPVLSLSGGITLEGAKFPLYRAAERAGDAEGKAKRHLRPGDAEGKAKRRLRPGGRGKDALCFLDTVVGWEDWVLVRDQKNELLWLVGQDAENRAREGDERERRLPAGLLYLVQGIHGLYQSGLQQARRRVRIANRGKPKEKKQPLPDPQMHFGRWTWMRVYAMTRLAERGKKRVPEAPDRIKQLQQEIMKPDTVRYSGLAARWAEYETRKEAGA